MTINSTVRTAGPFTGTGSTQTYPFSFKVFQASELLVVVTSESMVQTPLALSADYTVTLNSDQNATPGGAVLLLSPLNPGTRLDITSSLALLQPLSIPNQGGFHAQNIEDAFDRTTIQLQQQRADLNGAIRVPESVGSLPSLPAAGARALTSLVFDASGNPTVASALASGGDYQYGVPIIDTFAPGSGPTYQLSANPGLLRNIKLRAGPVPQKNGVAFTWDGGLNVTATPAFPSDVEITIEYVIAQPVTFSDASVTNYQPLGFGSVVGTVQDKLREVTSAKVDFGAFGDGVHDDTAALQAFFNRMSLVGGRGVIAAGSYLISSKLTIPIGALGWVIEGAGAASTVFQVSSSFTGGTVAVQLLGIGSVVQWRLGGFYIKPQSTSGTATTGFLIGDPGTAAININSFGHSELFDVVVNSFPTCWQFTHCRLIHVLNCAAWNLGPTQNTLISITQNGSATGDLIFDQFNGVTTRANANMAISVSSPVGPYNGASPNYTIAGIKFRSSVFYGGARTISIFAGAGSRVGDFWFSDGCQIDQQTTNCVYVESQNTSTEIDNLHFEGMYFNQATNATMLFTSTGSFGTIRGVVIDKCTMVGALAHCVLMVGTGVISPVVTNNQIIDCNNTGPAMEFNATSNPTISGNKARVDLLNQRPYYLIQLDAGCTNIQCCGNDGLNGVNIATVLDNSGDVSKNINGNGGFNPLPNNSISLGSSPFTWKNTLGSTATVFVTGGTVSAVTLAGKAVGSATNGCFAVPQGASLVVTYSSAPTMSYSGH